MAEGVQLELKSPSEPKQHIDDGELNPRLIEGKRKTIPSASSKAAFKGEAR